MRNAVVSLALVAAAWTIVLAAAQPAGPIVRLDPALDALVGADATLEKLSGDFKPSLEGGVWSRGGHYLLFSNKAARLINKWTPDAGVSVYLDLAKVAKVDDPDVNLSSGTTFDAQGRLVYASQGERAIIRLEPDGRRTVLVDAFEGRRFGSPNDLIYKKDGTLYFTDNPRDSPNGAYMFKSGQLTLITRGLRRPNGIALSPDEKVLYVNDSGGGGRRCVWRFEVQPDDSAINGRMWVDMSTDPAKGIPDGMRVDTKGNVWDGGPGGLWIMSPDGTHIGTIVTPDQVANLAFGDADGQGLFLTLHSALYRLRVKVPGLIP
jgi:gluconolactonase